jgi:hypothetical protein
MVVPFTMLKLCGVHNNLALMSFASLIGGLVFYNIDKYIFTK